MTILNDIVENTRAKLESKKAELPLAEIIPKLNELNLPKGAFKESLLNKDQAIIAEIKKAYRTMAKKYHPDKLIDMDEAYKKGAEQKFREVQESYESLQKERGF